MADESSALSCTVCNADSNNIAATCFCTACNKFYCLDCQKAHNRVLREHLDNILDKDAMPKNMPEAQSRATLTTVCVKHGKLVQMYCEGHNAVCCPDCLAMQHNKCEHKDYITKISDGYSKNLTVAKVKSDVLTVQDDIEDVRSSRENDQKRIKSERDHVLAELNDCRQKMNDAFDKLEEAIVTEADERYERYGDTIQADLKICDETLNKFEKLIQDLGSVDTSNEAQLFVYVKQAEESIDAWRGLRDEIKQNMRCDKINFDMIDSIELFMEKLEKLGDFVNEMRMPIKPRPVQKKKDVMVKMDDDSNSCRIWGSCCLPDGGILLTDRGNCKLKRLNASDEITDSLAIDGPIGVCYIGPSGEAVVCVDDAIKVVSLGPTMSVVRSIDMEGVECSGVKYNNGVLIVTEWAGRKMHVVEYDTGRRLVTVDTDQNEEELFSETMHLTLSNDGNKIWVVDLNKGLVVLDKDYNLVRVIKDDDMGVTRGICIDEENNVFVCSSCPNNVRHFNCVGEVIGTLLQKVDVPEDPMSMSYDSTQSRLIVTMDEVDVIKVAYLKPN